MHSFEYIPIGYIIQFYCISECREPSFEGQRYEAFTLPNFGIHTTKLWYPHYRPLVGTLPRLGSLTTNAW